MAHTLSLAQAPPYSSGSFVCNLCWEKGSGPLYQCANCEFGLHSHCAAIGKQQTHFTHFEHPLYLTSSGNNHTCDGCGENIDQWVFRCDLCDYDMHSLCVRAPRFVMHPSHHHVLTLFNASDLSGSCLCDGCGARAVGRVYRCSSCNYDLHQSCATLPLKVTHPKHVEHDLILLFQPPGRSFFTCHECKEDGKGWLFHCPLCRYNLHPGCANISHELPHVNVQTFSHERNVRAASPSSVMRNTTPAPIVSDADLEAAERILRFVRHSITETPSHLRHSTSRSLGSSSISLLKDDQDICPTCLEGYDLGNPKKITNCGHNFHLACLLEWMERSSHCPVCRTVMFLDDE